ncbi:hypothetical protein L0P88_04080 [Muricauda sp. SCSIO 64092]|uniref:hypothetical protein n=1 Tax=Allomuricauda sp. SCSIO 64092 TaxID=2908842 RepID=UPI001FF0F50F|nr:hypothetical protein [Muricauda sp. SCSIO 64092]UOY07733.1 hypothetical protein L0P88_04080 [Muricauda sp. SCSIO 64092]
MKKLLFLLVLFNCWTSKAQLEIDYMEFQGNFTTSIRDALDVPVGKVFWGWNITNDRFEFARADDVWKTMGDLLLEEYPNLDLDSTNDGTTYTAGSGLDLTGNTFSVDVADPIWPFALPADLNALLPLDGSRAMTGNLDMGTNGISNASEIAATQLLGIVRFTQSTTTPGVSGNGMAYFNDATNRLSVHDGIQYRDIAYADDISGASSPELFLKENVSVATTANITLSGTQAIDGVNVSSGVRVLVKDQTSAGENGIYIASTGAWTRATDANTTQEVSRTLVYVLFGSANANKFFQTNFATPNALGVQDVVFNEVDLYSTGGTPGPNSITTAMIQNGAVEDDKIGINIDGSKLTNNTVGVTKLQQIAQGTFWGRRAGIGTGNTEVLFPADARTILNVEDGAAGDQNASEVGTTVQNGVTESTVQAELEKQAADLTSATTPVSLLALTTSRDGALSDRYRQLVNSSGTDITYTFTTAQNENGATISFMNLSSGNKITFAAGAGVTITNPHETNTNEGSSVTYVCDGSNNWTPRLHDPVAYTIATNLYTNLDAANPNNETNSVANWVDNGGQVTVTSISTDPQNGSFHLRVTNNENNAYNRAEISVSGFTIGNSYTWTFYGKAINDTTDTMVSVVEGVSGSTRNIPSGSYGLVTTTFTANATTQVFEIYVADMTGNPISAYADIDNFLIVAN